MNTAYLNPRYGNDETAQLNSRARPFRTREAAHRALDEQPLQPLPPGATLPEGVTKQCQVHGRVVETQQIPPTDGE